MKLLLIVGIVVIAGLFFGYGLGNNDELTGNELIKVYLSNQVEFTYDVSRLIDWAYDNGYGLSFGEAWRSQETQEIYYEQGKTKTLNSKHKERLAVDFNLFIGDGYFKYTDNPEDYRPLGEYWESLRKGNKWGGRFGVKKEDYDKEVGWDTGHFERKGE